MRVRQVRIRLENWYPANYSAANTHDHELELYLWVDGRRTYQVFDYGASDVLAQGGLPGGVPADIREPRFRIRLVAIERDGWPDATGGAGGEITIELDRDPPVSTWTIVADGAGGDRPVEITFAVEYLTYLATPDHPGPDPHPIDDKARSDAGDRDARVFEHWLGLGRSSRLWPDPARKYHEQVWFIVPLDGEGRRGKQIVTTYRYRAEAIASTMAAWAASTCPGTRRSSSTSTISPIRTSPPANRSASAIPACTISTRPAGTTGSAPSN